MKPYVLLASLCVTVFLAGCGSSNPPAHQITERETPTHEIDDNTDHGLATADAAIPSESAASPDAQLRPIQSSNNPFGQPAPIQSSNNPFSQPAQSTTQEDQVIQQQLRQLEHQSRMRDIETLSRTAKGYNDL